MSNKNNSGDCNSGDCNSGKYNSGDCNSGDGNSGYRNSGYRNSGDYNSGNYNSGYRNSGDWNSGDYNSGNYNSGFFNTNEPTVRMFNQDTGKKRNEITIPHIYLPITKWIRESNMTTEQKKADPQFHVKGGTLIKQSYQESWAEYWAGAAEEDKGAILALPNFNAEIFKEITGIDLKQTTCAGKVVEIDGKRYRLMEV